MLEKMNSLILLYYSNYYISHLLSFIMWEFFGHLRSGDPGGGGGGEGTGGL